MFFTIHAMTVNGTWISDGGGTDAETSHEDLQMRSLEVYGVEGHSPLPQRYCQAIPPRL
jgi:hypothetical protein